MKSKDPGTWSHPLAQVSFVIFTCFYLFFFFFLLPRHSVTFFLCIHQQNLSSIAVDLVSLGCENVTCCYVAGLWKHTSLLLLLLLLLLLFFPAAQWGMRTGRCSVTIRAFVVSVLCRMNWGLFVDVEQLCGCGAERNWRNIFSVCQPAVSLPVTMHPSVLTLSVLCFPYHLNVCVCCSESGGARRGKAGQTGSLELEGMNFLHRRLGIHWSFRMFLCGAKTDFLRLL